MSEKRRRTLVGDCRQTLKTLPDKSVHCCITSPPYFNLRDYNVDDQIGLEKTPEEYVQVLVEVFREVKRVLRNDGTLWVVLGDSYSGGGTGGHIDNKASVIQKAKTINNVVGPKPKDLLGIPWRVAFALQEDGWYLRQDIIWNKPNPMPESVKDRCTKAHEYIFLLSKNSKYYYDADAIKEDLTESTKKRYECKTPMTINGQFKGSPTDKRHKTDNGKKISGDDLPTSRNKRSVWTVATQPYSEAHFAVYPEELITPCVLAGCPVGGTVLDPFAGSGTTGRVALRHRRKVIMCELNPEYVGMMNKRCVVQTSMI